MQAKYKNKISYHLTICFRAENATMRFIQGWIKEDFKKMKIFFFLLLIKENFSVIKEDFSVIKEDFSVIKEDFRNIRKITMTSQYDVILFKHNTSNLEIINYT